MGEDLNRNVFSTIDRFSSSSSQTRIDQYAVLLQSSPPMGDTPSSSLQGQHAVLNLLNRFDYSPDSKHGHGKSPTRSMVLHFNTNVSVIKKNRIVSGSSISTNISTNAYIGKALSSSSGGEINTANILKFLLGKKNEADGVDDSSIPASFPGIYFLYLFFLFLCPLPSFFSSFLAFFPFLFLNCFLILVFFLMLLVGV